MLVGLAMVPAYLSLQQARPASVWQGFTEGPTDLAVDWIADPTSPYYIADPDARRTALVNAWIDGIHGAECYYERGLDFRTCNQLDAAIGTKLSDSVALAERYYGQRIGALFAYAGATVLLLVLALVAFQSRRIAPKRGRTGPFVPRPGRGWQIAMLVVAVLGFVGAMVSGAGPVQFGNAAGVANGLFAAGIHVLMVYAIYALYRALLGGVTFVRAAAATG